MALFRFEALDARGKKVHSTIDAETLNEAKQKLAKQSIFIIRIETLSPRKAKPLLKRGEVLNFTHELSRLLKAGLPLYESLSAMEEKYRGQKAQPILLDLCEQVRGGRSFSSAIARHDKTFDLLYIAMLANAEKTGRLGPALEELTALLSKQQKSRKQLINALLYPMLLLGFCFFILGALLFYVIPSLEELFEGRDLHPFTQLVFSTSRFVRDWKWLIGIAFVLFGGSLFALSLFPRWKKFVTSSFMRLPLLNRLFSKVALIRFFRAVSTLLSGGVPIVASFCEARRALGHPILEKIIAHTEEAISQGQPIHVSLSGHELIPPLVPRMIGIAEKGGNLEGMMRQIAEIYDEDVERALNHFSTFVQPALLIFLGAIVGLVLLSVILPLTDVSTFATE